MKSMMSPTSMKIWNKTPIKQMILNIYLSINEEYDGGEEDEILSLYSYKEDDEHKFNEDLELESTKENNAEQLVDNRGNGNNEYNPTKEILNIDCNSTFTIKEVENLVDEKVKATVTETINKVFNIESSRTVNKRTK